MEPSVTRIAQRNTADAAGLFGPDSAIRRVSREAVLMLGGGRALLMQAAHPLAAAGIAAHSGYRENPWRRLERTMTAVWTVVYGTRAEAEAVGRRVRTMHERVHGRIAEPMGPYPVGTRYDATDPELLMWVHATLVDTAILIYERYVGPLGESGRDAYYADMKLLAQVFGTPVEAIPEDHAAFGAYMSERLGSEEICITGTAREIAATVLGPPVPLALRPAVELLNQVTVGLLPSRLRQEYGFSWDPARGVLLRASAEPVRRLLLPLAPAALRAIPPAREAERSEAA
jgi:uncharacterized protein (DUF2236 family)